MSFLILTGSFLVLLFFLALDIDWQEKRNKDVNLLYNGLYIIGWVIFSQSVVRLVKPLLGENRLPDWLLTIFIAIFIFIIFRLTIRQAIPLVVRIWPWKA